MDDNRPKLYARLRARIGSYEQDGKSKNRYADIGVLFASPHFSNMYMQIDTLPISKDWDGRIYVNQIESKEDDKPLKQHEVISTVLTKSDIDSDKPIDLADIPF
jgi:hypothetical protein